MMTSQLELLAEGGGGEAALWSRAALVACEVQRREIRPYVLLALKELSGEIEQRMRHVANTDRFSCVRSVVRHLARLRSARTGNFYNENDVRAFLEGLRFTPECVAELTALLCAEEVYAGLPAHSMSSRRLVSAECRLDISLWQVNQAEARARDDLSGVACRDATVVLTLRIAGGETRAYRLSVSKFHELRHCVASLLKNVIVLERRRAVRRD